LSRLLTIPGVALKYDQTFFNEFVTTLPVDAQTVNTALAKKGILGGLACEDGILWCVTEKNSKEQIDEMVNIIKEVCVSCN
jgi:glycine dehydrogenase subunit 1